MSEDRTGQITVWIVEAWPDRAEQREISLPAGATLRDALLSAGLVTSAQHAESDIATGVWGKNIPLDTPLRDGDRVERYRPITADPKLARRQRASQQGYRWQARTRRAAQAPST